ncbi:MULTISPECIES: hypothetical protein [unclassified Rhizobium]|uniref:hypothetical protein n=1 Tax=unclassified Rhizobium TaxID=2613769 RepID=UPI0007EA0877|nr:MULTISPECIES: hypothetical protein [unclassified Rhizobium]ANM09227.1 hypothetical protein AMK05_CH00798 [Rhizobium sp. N324]OYD02795.1 hypothetical protein AMK08_CH100794 [Rhizobium sp. N4311]
MPQGKPKPRLAVAFPEIEVGDWRGEFAGPPNGNIGQHIQPGPPIKVVEFTYLLAGAVVISPISKFHWPAVVSFWVRTPLTPERVEAGFMFKSDEIPSVNVSFDVTREQFSEVCWLFREKLLKNFHFRIGPGTDNHWPLQNWGATFGL